MASPYSLGADTQLDDPEALLKDLPPELQEAAKRGLAALPNIPPEAHAQLAQQGGMALMAHQASQMPKGFRYASSGPYGVPGGQNGPETEAQATDEKIAAQKQNEASRNQQFMEAQAGGPFSGVQRLPEAKPVAARSGLANHQKLIADMLNKASDIRPQGMAPEELQAQAQALSDIPAVKSAQEGLKTQENLLNMQLGQKTSPLETANIGPLMALMDHYLGSNTAAAYKAPEGAGAKQKAILDALQKVQTDRQALAGNIVHGIQASKGGAAGDVTTSGQKFEQFQGAGEGKGGMGDARNIRALVTDVKGDMHELNAANAATQEAQRMLASGGSILDTTFRDKFLKAMIGGRVTNYDIMRQSGDTALADRAEQVWNTMESGTFSPKNRAEYQDALRIIQEANAHEANARLNDWREVGTGAFGLEPSRVESALHVGHGGNFAPVAEATLGKSADKSHKKMNAVTGDDLIRVRDPATGKTYKMPAANAKKAQAKGLEVLHE